MDICPGAPEFLVTPLPITTHNRHYYNVCRRGITIRYDTRCYFNVRSKADISQLNLPHGTDN